MNKKMKKDLRKHLESLSKDKLITLYLQKCFDTDVEKNNLEMKILEKERKIEDLMLCEFVATTLDFNKLSADNIRLREQIQQSHLNKVSFCIERLEKVKDKIDNIHYFNSESECNVVDSYEIWSFVDNLIEQLKASNLMPLK